MKEIATEKGIRALPPPVSSPFNKLVKNKIFKLKFINFLKINYKFY